MSSAQAQQLLVKQLALQAFNINLVCLKKIWSWICQESCYFVANPAIIGHFGNMTHKNDFDIRRYIQVAVGTVSSIKNKNTHEINNNNELNKFRQIRM